MLNLDYITEAFQVHLTYQTRGHLKRQLTSGGRSLDIRIKPALQTPDAAHLSEKLNLHTSWSALQKVIHPHSIASYLPQLRKVIDENGAFNYFISFKQLSVSVEHAGQFEWFFCFTRLHPQENRLFLLYVSLAAGELWRREAERFVRQETYRLDFAEKFNDLTQREKEVLELVARGNTNPQTAQELGISRRTVESHRKNINRKLGMNNLVELVRFALAFDLV